MSSEILFSKKPNKKKYNYALDAAELLDQCLKDLRQAMELKDSQKQEMVPLYEMEDILVAIDMILHSHLLQLIETERVQGSSEQDHNNDDSDDILTSLSECVRVLRSILQQSTKSRENQRVRRSSSFPDSIQRPDRLIRRSRSDQSSVHWQHHDAGDQATHLFADTFFSVRSTTDNLLFRLVVALRLCLVRIHDAYFVLGGTRMQSEQQTGLGGYGSLFVATLVGSSVLMTSRTRRFGTEGFALLASKVAIGVVCVRYLSKWWGYLWMANKILKSVDELEAWRKQWIHVHGGDKDNSAAMFDKKSQRLIECVKNQNPKSALWHSEGELRFLVLKRTMDLLYASVGAAVEATKDQSSQWKMPLATMAAAWYYSVVGPNQRAAQAVSSSSRELIEHAWGMVSLPSIKLLSLRASRLLKRANLAERVIIAGVPCFILSKNACPEASAALKRHERQERRRSKLSRLSTIDESDHHRPQRRRARSIGAEPRNVILHLTGGGFFAHTIASDVPYLLDWSDKTGAVVICPEYALLPENAFPVALNQVCQVYRALVQGEDASLGFEANRVVVTGESVGGNLAAALCVKLCTSSPLGHESLGPFVRLPHALMLSCPALNLSLELSPSRVLGNKDPVLPLGLISAISNTYLPNDNNNKKDPLASPLFAPDSVLKLFPPTLLFASSDDPLLDDAVDFNRRLLCLGVHSDLRVTHNLPHAYWGLGTAGFPEARRVQTECQDYLKQQLQ